MKNLKKYWWQFLLAIPPTKDEMGFKRIERIIKDKTRYSRLKSGRLHEFYNKNHETNLTISLWENFSIFDSYEWVNELLKFTNFDINEKVIACNWSYEWEKRIGNRIKLCDVVLNFKTAQSNNIIVIEAKNLGKVIGEKDAEVTYYLDIEDFENYDNKCLVFCIDKKKKSQVEALIKPTKENYGIITWQELAKLQLDMVDRIKVNPRIKTFMKAAIYHQYVEKGITPSSGNIAYLENEPAMEEYVEMTFTGKDMQNKIWEV